MFLPFGSFQRTTRRRVPPLKFEWGAALLVPIMTLLTGCDRDAVRTYQVPKEKVATPATIPNPHGGGAGGMMTGGAPAPSAPSVRWQLPAGWEELEPNQFRVGNFRIPEADGPGAEVTIIPLPGMAGTDLANVNRWRGQVGLPPVAETELSGLSDKVSIGGEDGVLFDLAGGQPADGAKLRMLSAILRRGDTAWFIKATGPDELVAGQREAFVKFLAGLSFDAAPAAAPAPASAPASVPSAAGTTDASAWKTPEGWVAQQPGSMQMAKFTVSGEGGQAAEISIATLGGDGGGLLANVNRWRRQLGLGAIAADGLSQCVAPIADGPAGAQLITLQAGDGAAAMTTAVVTVGDQTWFIKLLGAAPVVSRERDHLIAFVKGIDYGR